jgi:hypothetical protein
LFTVTDSDQRCNETANSTEGAIRHAASTTQHLQPDQQLNLLSACGNRAYLL